MTIEYNEQGHMQIGLQQSQIDRAIEEFSDIPEGSAEQVILRHVAITNYLAGEKILELAYCEHGICCRALKPLPPSVLERVSQCALDVESNLDIAAMVNKMEEETQIAELRALTFVSGALDDMASEGILIGPTLLTDSGSLLRKTVSELYGVPTNGELAWAMATIEAYPGSISSAAKTCLYERAKELRCKAADPPPDEAIERALGKWISTKYKEGCHE